MHTNMQVSGTFDICLYHLLGNSAFKFEHEPSCDETLEKMRAYILEKMALQDDKYPGWTLEVFKEETPPRFCLNIPKMNIPI